MAKSKNLTNKRAEDRRTNSQTAIEFLTQDGVELELTDYAKKVWPDGTKSSHTRRLVLLVTVVDRVDITICFDGDAANPDCYISTWNSKRGVYLNPRIGDVNPHHFGKAMRVTHNLMSLLQALQRDIDMFKDGTGFLCCDSPELQMMKKRYEEQGWQWYGACGESPDCRPSHERTHSYRKCRRVIGTSEFKESV